MVGSRDSRIRALRFEAGLQDVPAAFRDREVCIRTPRTRWRLRCGGGPCVLRLDGDERGHIAQANTLIATTIKDFSSTGWRYRPPFIDPIFVDGSPAAALVLEYIPDAEVLQARNITYELAA